MEYLKRYWHYLTKKEVKSFKWLFLLGSLLNFGVMFDPELAAEPAWSVALAFMIVMFAHTAISYAIYCALAMLIEDIFFK